MQFSLRVICSCCNVETVKQRTAILMDYLGISKDYVFLPYWKDEKCVISEICANIENPDYEKIREYVRIISGADSLSEFTLPGEWECAYFASLDELHSDMETAFVECNIFTESYIGSQSQD